MDQAEKLRDLINKKQVIPPRALGANVQETTKKTERKMRVIAVTSGKGGVGKSNLSINLAIQLVRNGQRVIVIDADFGLANIEVLLGVSPQYTFQDVLSGNVALEEALTLGPEGVRFLSGGSGFVELANLTEGQAAMLINSFDRLDEITDILLIDTGAGLTKNILKFLKVSDEVIVISTSDPTSVTDAYALIKVLLDADPMPPRVKIVVNRVDYPAEGQEVFKRLHRVCNRFLNYEPENLGSIPYDRNLSKAVKMQEPVVALFPNAPSAQSIAAIGRRLLNVEGKSRTTKAGSFFERWLGFKRK